MQRGVGEATGDYILVQDADLEYEPGDYLALLRELEGADVVYGSRTLGPAPPSAKIHIVPRPPSEQGVGPWFAASCSRCGPRYVRPLDHRHADAYKLYPANVLKSLNSVPTALRPTMKLPRS